ncbi:hypothetical protein [Paraliomyxa miuraensis]|uniref:hypothetical protein n=1 Tax=Paraliomyxa miuraensis TaxID=376150 RepID=UPI00224F4D59|nr:hypothetical protein [Paraliomyxa miuraensis]MCX4246676.1 hypothetical protein [Paraliomyxa miuraensis]
MPRNAVLAVLPLWLAACPSSDVGRPCNHGPAFVPQGQAITFPALACDDLLCVYAEDVDEPAGTCSSDADCNGPEAPSKFHCEEGSCALDQAYVLQRSMCSQSCESDADCDGGDPDTTCHTGFACARIQSLGDHCCEKLCVCRDDLDLAAARQLEVECRADTAQGCCDRDPHPTACGS